MLLTTQAKSLYKTCLSLNPETTFTQGWEEQKAQKCAFLFGYKYRMPMKLKYSGLWPVKHEAPIGNPAGYYQQQKPKKKQVKPAQTQPKR